MVRHIVSWNYAEHLTAEERVKAGADMKRELENLVHLIDGLESIHVYLDHLPTSDADIVLDSVLVSEEALNQYTVHPEHVRVGSNFVKPFVMNRKCVDVQM